MENNLKKDDKFQSKKTFTEKIKNGFEKSTPYLYISPFYILFIMFSLFPLIFSVVLALGKWDGIGEITYVGLANFRRLVQDLNFWRSLKNTIIIWFLGTFPMLFLSLIYAFLINQKFVKFKNALRTILFLPNVTSVVAITILFGIIFANFGGLANGLLEFFGFDSINWLQSPFWVRIIIALINIWMYMGYNMIIYLTGIINIPDELYEAASLDGASSWQMFRNITIPQLKPIIFFTVIMSTIGGLQVFTEAQVLVPTGATPEGGAVTVMYYMYQNAFTNNQYGYGSAIAWAMALVIVIISAINSYLTSRMEGNK
ncbi:carbohydrate ABC transporter permease [Fundicoccus culcitae]|uniref:Sugar ABC transporter permease n=1 Tax=Fundicoccus culcitae TaxID=2969821 RepID=A0ABY5P955_9LACT|nr:sugar ABC transporter permease [Fundicoccus culcitae]UUX35277.1 sugar ABC transporter permease [Fundicoccus culcitae]